MSRRVRPSILALGLVLLGAPGVASLHGRTPTRSPQAALDDLLSADRAFSAASMQTDVIAGLSAMFADDVVMPVPGGPLAEGKAKVVDALRGNPDNARSRIEWSPIRGGISADGEHGFTLGFMTLHPPDGPSLPLKYLAYWVKRAEGWRVAAYNRRRRPEGTVAIEPKPAALPARMVPPSTDARAVAAFRESLDRAERAFSRDAQRIGLGAAFVQYGSPDAVNMGSARDAGFVVGPERIGRLVASGEPATGSSVSWAPDRVLVSSSGDLGVTIGTIRPNAPVAGSPSAGYPFFTVWRRASPNDPWRYVAE